MKRKFFTTILVFAMMTCLLSTHFSSIVVAAEEITLISNRTELENIKKDTNGSYRLTADIDLAGEDWTPLPEFYGTLDGGGYVIRNLTITDTTDDTGTYKGLFSANADGKIANLGIEDANITANNYAGIIAGENGGTISCCYTTGTVSGGEYVGGIAGSNNDGVIENCYSRASVSGKNYLGGIAGGNTGRIIKNCYAASTVTDSVMNNYLEFNATPMVNDNPVNSGGYINIPHNNAYTGSAFTIEAWFEWDDIEKTGLEGINFIVGKGDSTHIEQFEIHTAGNGLRFIPIPDGPIGGSTGSFDGDAYIDVHDVLKPGWFHVAAVYSYSDLTHKASVQVYVNGEAQDLWQGGSAARNVGKTASISRSSNPLASNDYPINIGRRTDNSFYFDGRIADVRFWNTARRGEEIKANKDRVLNGDEKGLVGYWRLNELNGPAIDSSNTGNNGTVIGDVTRVTSNEAAANKGALTGSGTLTNCFYDSTLYGSGSGGAGMAKQTNEMKTQSTYTGWNFDTIWKMGDDGYPCLRFITVNSVTIDPSISSITKGSSKIFTPTVTGANNPAQTVTWSISGNNSASTTISLRGVLTVAAVETATTITVTATSTIDTAKSGTATVTLTAPIDYRIIQGSNGEWTGNAAGICFTADADFNKFTGVSVDNTNILGDNYTAKSGSTVVTLKNSYLETLSTGRHTLRINFTDGYAETYFTVKAATSLKNPATGDGSQFILWLGIILLASAGLTVHRKRYNK